MATKEEVRNWILEEEIPITDEDIEKLLDEMIKDGEMEEVNGLYYITEKGYYEFMYGKFAHWEEWNLKKVKKNVDKTRRRFFHFID